MLRAAVFASGRGSNFEVLADHASGASDPLWEVVLLLSDREGAGALARATARGISSAVVPVGGEGGSGPDRILARLSEARIDFILLAGYLRLIPPEVVARFRGRILNLHPALLPGFGGQGMYGRRVHEAVLASGARISGATVHLVDEAYDRGRILAQWPVPVLVEDTPESLQARVQEVEHRLYPAAADALARAILAGAPVENIPQKVTHFQSANQAPDLP